MIKELRKIEREEMFKFKEREKHRRRLWLLKRRFDRAISGLSRCIK